MLSCCTYMPIEATLWAGYTAQLMHASPFTLEASIFAVTTQGTFQHIAFGMPRRRVVADTFGMVQGMRADAHLHLLHQHCPVCSQALHLQLQYCSTLARRSSSSEACALLGCHTCLPCTAWQAAGARLLFSLAYLHGKLQTLLCICEPVGTKQRLDSLRSFCVYPYTPKVASPGRWVFAESGATCSICKSMLALMTAGSSR